MRENSNSDLFFHSNFKRLIGNSIEKVNQKKIGNGAKGEIYRSVMKAFLRKIEDCII